MPRPEHPNKPFIPYPPASHPKAPTLDILQRIDRKLAQYNASQNPIKRWIFEIISVGLSTACMAALILPISEALGQLKWTWFHGENSRDAFDFEIFDKASRGAWGSFLLLCRTKGRSLAALGALLMLLLMAIDTFFQQMTDLPERWKLHGESFIPRTVRYAPITAYAYDSEDDEPLAQVNNDMKGAIFPFFYDQNGTHSHASGTSSQSDIPISCSTSRCEWPIYETLGVCSSCTDITNLLEYACLPMRMDWIRNSTGPGTESTYPNGTACGYFLNSTSHTPVLMSGYRVEGGNEMSRGETLLMRTLPLVTNPSRTPLYGGSINFKHVNFPLIDAIIVSSADGTVDSVYRKEMPIAHECLLAWCTKTLKSSQHWGQYKEEVLTSFLNTTKAKYPWYTEFDPLKDWTLTGFNATISLYPPSEKNHSLEYGVSNQTFFHTVTILDEIFPSLLTVANATAQPFLKIRTSFIDRVMFRAVRFNPWLAPNNVTHHMERMATAMTNLVRSDSNSNELITGSAYAPEIYISVQWVWLTFPIVMLLLSIVFLVSTIIKTSRGQGGTLGVWKTSAMPTLIYSLPKDVQQDFSAPQDWGESKKIRIKLLPDQGWRVSGYQYGRPDDNDRRAPFGWI
ncbi:hypothetical protein J1614_010167 [Plenodomus biglobosus]|nr:hypothetical protein J1614_010167 [Plenodomus biglobosus]